MVHPSSQYLALVETLNDLEVAIEYGDQIEVTRLHIRALSIAQSIAFVSYENGKRVGAMEALTQWSRN